MTRLKGLVTAGAGDSGGGVPTLPLPSLAVRQTQLCLGATEQHLLFWQQQPALHFFGSGGTHLQFVSLTSESRSSYRCVVHMCCHTTSCLCHLSPLNPRLNKQSNPTPTNFVSSIYLRPVKYVGQQENVGAG